VTFFGGNILGNGICDAETIYTFNAICIHNLNEHQDIKCRHTTLVGKIRISVFG